MLIRRVCAPLMALALLLTCGVAVAAEKGRLEVRSTRAGATVAVERMLKEGQVLVSASDAEKNPLLGLAVRDFAVSQAGIQGKVISAQPLTENLEVTRQIVLVLDNSYSMYERNAIKPLLAGIDSLLKIVRPIDRVHLVVFDNKQATTVGGRQLHVQTFSSSSPDELRAFAKKAYSQQGLTATTVLYEGMLAGLDIVAKLPATDPRILVVFSDGEDLNSVPKQEDVSGAAQGIGKFNAYAIDYMPEAAPNKFLTSFVSQRDGKIWKARSEENLVPIFESVASRLQHYYVVTYAFAPTGTIAVAPAELKVEEIKTIDSSPMLGHIFFDKGSSEIPSLYVRFTEGAETAGFDEQKFRDTGEKYRQMLNIVGKRLADKPAATVTLIGCNDNSGIEKGKTKLSGQRAEAVRSYLQTVWGIAPERMTVQARNLPQMPSSAKSAEGQAENRRVEIVSSDMAILAPIRSVYTNGTLSQPELVVTPTLASSFGVADWTVTASNSSGTIAEQSGSGPLPARIAMPLTGKDPLAIGSGGDINVKLALKDKQGQPLEVSSEPVKVDVSQVSQRKAQKKDQHVREKYALILFDFNKDTISGVNQEIIKKIAERIKTLPQAKVDIVGHTDNVGSLAYNMKLSQRRAAEATRLLAAAYGEPLGERVRTMGVGPNEPLFDNKTPEGRAFNRTVTIVLQYEGAEE